MQQYLNLLDRILTEGTKKTDRTGTGTISIFRMNDRYIRVAWKHTKELPYVLLDEENLTDGYKHIMEELSLIRRYKKIWTDGKYSLYYSKPYPGPERPKITDVDPYRHHP